MSSDAVLVREMGCTEVEFARWLPGATRSAPIDTSRDGNRTRHCVAVDGGSVEIVLEARPPRRIALFVLPVLQVSFRFIGLDDTQRAAFLEYFDRYTRRGGG
jgi:hypothetical protein